MSRVGNLFPKNEKEEKNINTTSEGKQSSTLLLIIGCFGFVVKHRSIGVMLSANLPNDVSQACALVVVAVNINFMLV